ncbi:MAG: Single-stranded-DNA-specific exonuclease RecJ [Syntrophorhabdus sp. PtaU1.Bin058]|nr:MAG: Single-stranded-DNA-specific exonuclease RecJ [Syntrophorhabdus sp. PtaU1.Bin058]
MHNGQDNSDIVRSIEKELGVPNLMARILATRGITGPEEAEAFLYPKLEDLSDPFLMPDMEKGVMRVVDAVQQKETICLYGDYDADGVTCLALLMNFLRHLGATTPLIYIPERKEGYGLNPGAVKVLKEKGVHLLVCLDCGATNVEEIGLANNLGIDTIVIDHHEMGTRMPPALAVINPKREDSRFPTRELAACGVAFFFLQALRRVMNAKGLLGHTINLKQELDIVAVGTVGDMVPLIKDNRIMVRHGMDMMKKRPRAWCRSLIRNKVMPDRHIDEYILNFIIVPRINASGRVSNPLISLDFLTCEDDEDSALHLKKLQEANKRRQQIEKGIIDEIMGILKKDDMAGRNSIVLFKKGWHIGVLGIVAQKVMEMYGKPSIIITNVDDIWKGSGRGSDNMDLHGAISSLSDLLIRFGGHRYACGITISEDNLVPFRDAFDNSLNGLPKKSTKTVHIDTHAGFDELTKELIECIEQLSPFGMGNPRPNLLLTPSSIAPVNNGRVKIVDHGKRTWYGYSQEKIATTLSGDIRIVASPVLRQENGEMFINLNIKQLL